MIHALWEGLKDSRRRAPTRRILNAGGPRTLAEYRIIFPDACRKCGSRDFLHYIDPSPGAAYPEDDPGDTHHYICKRCGLLEHKFDMWPGIQFEGVERRSAPFLTPEQADAIPDWPYVPAAPELAQGILDSART
jgi:hypothetical protein